MARKFYKGGWKYSNPNEKFRFANDLWTKKAKTKLEKVLNYEKNELSNNLDYSDINWENKIQNRFKKEQPNVVSTFRPPNADVDSQSPTNDTNQTKATASLFQKQKSIAQSIQLQLQKDRERVVKEKKQREKLIRENVRKRKQQCRAMMSKTRSGQPRMQGIIRNLTEQFLEKQQ